MTQQTVEAGGRTRTFTTVGTSAPNLVLVFHGSKQNGRSHRKFAGHAYDRLAEDGRAMVAYLDGFKGNWNDARRESRFPARRHNIDDVAFTRAVVRKLADDQGIDERRVFAAGYSNGGQMVMRLIHEAPGLLAGAAIFGSTMPAPESFLAPTAPAAALPVVLAHGTDDPIVPFEGGQMTWWKQKVFRVGGSSRSMPETAAYFAERNGISGAPVTTRLPPSENTTSLERSEYRQDGRPPVVLYRVHGGGHTVPGSKDMPFVGRSNRDRTAADLISELLEAPQSEWHPDEQPIQR